MSNVLYDDKQEHIVALGRLVWTLRRIEQALAVGRETVSGYLRAAGIPARGCGRPSESKPKHAISVRCPPVFVEQSKPVGKRRLVDPVRADGGRQPAGHLGDRLRLARVQARDQRCREGRSG